jgi:hypothetical protein
MKLVHWLCDDGKTMCGRDVEKLSLKQMGLRTENKNFDRVTCEPCRFGKKAGWRNGGKGKA